jgi:cytochrome c-type biogenesis protein
MEDVSLLAGGLTAVVAGVLSFLSPCVLPLMPAYLSFVSGISIDELRTDSDAPSPADADSEARSRTVLLGSLGFIAGFSAVFIAIGASATAIGRVVTGLRFDVFGYTLTPAHLAGAIIVLFGLHLMGVLKIPILYREQRLQLAGGAGALRASVLGAAFAFGWTPCIGPVLAGILTIAAGQDSVARGVFLLALYSMGLGIPFFLMALSLDRFYRVFERIKRHFRAIEIVSGGLLVVVGVLVMSNSLVVLNSYLSFMTDFVLRIEETIL